MTTKAKFPEHERPLCGLFRMPGRTSLPTMNLKKSFRSLPHVAVTQASSSSFPWSAIETGLRSTSRIRAGQNQDRSGEDVYNTNCAICHGDQLVNSGQTFDLRRLKSDERPRFENSVRNGKNQMPRERCTQR